MTEAVPRPTHEKVVDLAASRLESWKEIATYLNRGVRTVQRWEQTEALPVHRHRHDKRGTVYAFRHEIDAWRENRTEGTGAAAGGRSSAASGYWAAVAASGARVAEALRRLVPPHRKPRARMAALILFSLAVIVVWVKTLGGAG
jgi:hypothetical protein